MKYTLALMALLTMTITSCTTRPVVKTEQGKASWYSRATNSPRGTGITASGVTFHDHHPVAAHKHLPFGTEVKFTNLATGASENVTIIDRGPYVSGRIIDVSVGVAQRTGFYGRGVTPCKVEVLAPKRKNGI